jgi:hypothetical protein
MNKKPVVAVAAFLALLLITFVVSSVGSASPAAKRGFTPEEVTQIQQVLHKESPAHYRIVLPVFRGQRIVGSKTYGTLPVTEVRKIASLRNVTAFTNEGNLQAIFDPNAAGGGGGGDKSGGPGSHINAQTAGTELGHRIEQILANVDHSEYVFLY